MRARIWILGFLLLTAVAIGIGVLVACIQYAKAGSGLDTDSLDFALFKNTDYAAECGRGEICPDHIVSRARPVGSSGVLWFDVVISPAEFCACFSDYKIAPSTPRESAFSYGWASIALDQTYSLATGLYAYLAFLLTDDVGRLWPALPLIGSDVFSTVSWWVSLIMAAVQPAFRQTPSLLQWITPWRYVYLGLHQRKPWLAALAVLILIAEWSATVAIIVRQNVILDPKPTPAFQRYDLQMSSFDTSPGRTNCTADVVRGLTGLFVVPEITNGDQDVSQSVVRATYFATFVFNTIAGVAALIYYAVGDSGKSTQRSFILMMVAMGIMEYWILGSLALQKTVPQAVILLHPTCEVVHITVSRHRSYFDVDKHMRVWRIIRAWANV
jgi:hypothetical protein